MAELAKPTDQATIDAFHVLHYLNEKGWPFNTYMGWPIYQCPIDMYIYQEVLFHVRPAFVLQTGVAQGGSLFYFASLLDLIGADADTLVVGVDVKLSPKAMALNHPRIRLIEGSSTDPAIVERVRATLPRGQGMVSLDSDHTREHVARELQIYCEFVAKGSYLVVEDTNLNGRPIRPEFGPGPFEAVYEFLRSDPRFAPDDLLWQRQLFSFHQFGWLCRVAW